MRKFRHPALKATGLFATLNGPFGRGPVQFEGTLTTGQFVYFKARETKIEVHIYPSEADFGDDTTRLAYFRETVPYDAGLMSSNECAFHIERLVRAFVAKLETKRRFRPRRPRRQ